MSSKVQRAEIKVTGLVQGVFFRQGVKEEATGLGLTGFTWNSRDGSLGIVTEGEEEKLQKLVEWCRKGTVWAKVEKVEVEWKEASGEFTGFDIR